MQSSFFAFVDRTKYINRWGLMRSIDTENVCEHSMQTAVLAHALAVAARDVFGKDIDPNRIAAAALYHDCSEILTGDMPTPVKYKSGELEAAYKKAETEARERLFATLPEELKAGYMDAVFFEERQPELYRYVKAADKLSAYLKCLNETRGGNREFSRAEATVKASLERMAESMEELKWFMDNVLPSYSMTLDDL
ncbi:MAG: 5'-deoxynucleotidase [Clostridiales bacterium]|nr:5'-deoxynucleotidase [Clostridiales bacterium]